MIAKPQVHQTALRSAAGLHSAWRRTSALLMIAAVALCGYWAAPAPADAHPATHPLLQATPSPTPTPVRVLKTGRLNRWNAGDGCASPPKDATLVECDNPAVEWPLEARAPLNLEGYIGRVVRLEGIVLDCAGKPYIQVQNINAELQCGAPTSPKTKNLALGKPAVAFRNLPGFDSPKVTDGRLDSFWYSDIPTDRQSAWLYVDLERPTTFNQVNLRWGEQYATQYALYVWDDSYRKWVPASQVTQGVGGDEKINLVRTYARYVMIVFGRSNLENGGYSLREFEIYGVSAPNFVLGQGAYADSSSAQPGFPPADAFDGDLETGWRSTAGEPQPWIRVRTPASSKLTEFRLSWRDQLYPTCYLVAFYRGNQPYVLTEALCPTDSNQRLAWYTPAVIDAFAVRAASVPSTPNYVELLEMELYGPEQGVFGNSGAAAGEASENKPLDWLNMDAIGGDVPMTLNLTDGRTLRFKPADPGSMPPLSR